MFKCSKSSFELLQFFLISPIYIKSLGKNHSLYHCAIFISVAK